MINQNFPTDGKCHLYHSNSLSALAPFKVFKYIPSRRCLSVSIKKPHLTIVPLKL